MPDRIKAILEKIKEWWTKFSKKQKTLLVSITAVVPGCTCDIGSYHDETEHGCT